MYCSKKIYGSLWKFCETHFCYLAGRSVESLCRRFCYSLESSVSRCLFFCTTMPPQSRSHSPFNVIEELEGWWIQGFAEYTRPSFPSSSCPMMDFLRHTTPVGLGLGLWQLDEWLAGSLHLTNNQEYVQLSQSSSPSQSCFYFSRMVTSKNQLAYYSSVHDRLQDQRLLSMPLSSMMTPRPFSSPMQVVCLILSIENLLSSTSALVPFYPIPSTLHEDLIP